MKFPFQGGWRGTPVETVPSLTHLSGACRGRVIRLAHRTYHLCRSEAGEAFVSEDDAPEVSAVVARLHPAEESYELEVKRGSGVRLNGARVLNAVLEKGDVIEVENSSLLLRYGCAPRVGDDQVDLLRVFDDCVKRTRFESRSTGGFLTRLPVNVVVDLSIRSSTIFRASVIAVLALLVFSNLFQWTRSTDIARQLAAERTAMQDLAEWFEQQQGEFISRSELADISESLNDGLFDTRQRIEALETRSLASERVVADASRAVFFLQGSWVFEERETGRRLRYAVSGEGRPMVLPGGHPLTSMEGPGPVAFHQFTGTAFVVDGDGRLMTSRHVAHPWEDDPRLDAMAAHGIEPVIDRFLGYLPGIPEPFEVSLESVSAEADLAVLRCADITVEIPHIELADTAPRPGEEVFVLGYPTGLRALLARTSEDFVERIRTEQPDFWTIARRLAEADMIRPLASRGIVGQVSTDMIAYDADTTRGGSGGPVLNARGELVAVNHAIIPDFGGSNLGVPVTHVAQLLNFGDSILNSTE